MKEWINEGINENILKESACILEWELRLQILTLIHKDIFSLPWITSRVSQCIWFVQLMHHRKVPDWGLVKLKPSSEPWHEAPYYNLLKGSMCAGRSPGHFGTMSSLCSECCMIYYPYILIPYFWLSFYGFILLTEVSMTMEMDLAANFPIIPWPHV